MPASDSELKQRLEALQNRDEVQRATIASYGIDLAKTRRVELSFWAPDEHRAQLLSDALQRNEGGAPIVLPPADPNDARPRWLVGISMGVSIDFITAKDNVATFLLFADKYDCEYDGWGTALVEAAAEIPAKGETTH
jgi:hypothetical protein